MGTSLIGQPSIYTDPICINSEYYTPVCVIAFKCRYRYHANCTCIDDYMKLNFSLYTAATSGDGKKVGGVSF